MAAVRPIPEGFHTVTVYLTVPNSVEAIAFYKKAFGAKEISIMAGPDGNSTVHAEIKIGDSIVMLSDENIEFGTKSPNTLGGTASSVLLYVPDVDATFEQAMKAGCQVVHPLMNCFWGDRMGKLADKFGHMWGIATHIEDVAPDEMQRRMDAWNKEYASKAGGS